MPQIDLDRSQYADRDPRTGKWRRPQSKRSAKWWFFGSLIPLVFFLSRASELQPTTALCVGAMFAFFAGVFASNWLRDLY